MVNRMGRLRQMLFCDDVHTRGDQPQPRAHDVISSKELVQGTPNVPVQARASVRAPLVNSARSRTRLGRMIQLRLPGFD